MPVSVKLSDELVEKARSHGAANGRSMPEQIEFWAKTARAAEANPDLPVEFIIDILEGIEEGDDDLAPFDRASLYEDEYSQKKPLLKIG